MLNRTHVGGEAVALQRRLCQLQQMLQAMVDPSCTNGGIPTSSMLSEDVFIFGGEIDTTSTVEAGQQWREQEVFMDFPVRWTSGMKDLYVALYACRSSGRWVSEGELSTWTDLPREEVKECLRWLSRAKKVCNASDGVLWRISTGVVDGRACL